jgi:hypothetical protein
METNLDPAPRSPSNSSEPTKHSFAKISFSGVVRASLWALAITSLQIAIACWLSGKNSIAQAYLSLFQWDSIWYASIVNNGYFSTIPPDMSDWGIRSNVAFFPGYPLSGLLIKTIFQLPTQSALLVASQLACVGCWTYIFLLLQRWQVHRTLSVISIMAILVYPGSFYLVSAYSEPLFIMSLLGLIYWTGDDRPHAWVWAAIHGFCLSATRIAGIPLAIYPLLFVWSQSSQVMSITGAKAWIKANLKYLAICVISALGGILFFAFCQLKFGYWDLYMQSQISGWWTVPDYLILFRPWVFKWIYKLFTVGLDTDLGLVEFGDLHFPYSDEFSRITIPFTLFTFFSCLGAEIAIAVWHKDHTWKQRLGIYFCAWLVFYISAAGMANRALGSMIRHDLPAYMLLVLAIASLLVNAPLARSSKPKNLTISIIFLLVLLSSVSLAVQGLLEHRFTHGLWVS